MLIHQWGLFFFFSCVVVFLMTRLLLVYSTLGAKMLIPFFVHVWPEGRGARSGFADCMMTPWLGKKNIMPSA